MTRTLFLELSEEIYGTIQQRAGRLGISPAQWVVRMLERDYASRQVSFINDPVIDHLVNMYEIPLDAVVEEIEGNAFVEECLKRLAAFVADVGPRANLLALARDDTFQAHWQLTKQLLLKARL